MDAACSCPLAVIGVAALPPRLRDRVRRMERGELDEDGALAVRAEVEALAALLSR